MKRYNLSPLLRRRMMVFLHARGHKVDGQGTNNTALKKMVAAELGVDLVLGKAKSDLQIYEALADVTVSKSRRLRRTDAFFQSREWLELRYLVLKREGARCQCCGNRGVSGNPLQVDHIKPRSKYPELALDATNLQVLCRDCNIGKSAWDETDWRQPAYIIVSPRLAS